MHAPNALRLFVNHRAPSNSLLLLVYRRDKGPQKKETNYIETVLGFFLRNVFGNILDISFWCLTSFGIFWLHLILFWIQIDGF